ncbi:neuronal-specific septin-3 isoform X2 [Ochotona princeps]|uniref:neuronal-specific septin-3 isoform X2 n=1 Tax=Ochotona princeps TaxID=9978 RepID=UPI002714B539|nr:neuronal-specific septin-3 isoform X2 [Ochotona princeps]
MDHSFAPTPPETQPQGAAFSHSHMLGHPARPSRLSGGVSPLLPVHRKTIYLDAFPKSHIPQTSGRPGPAARAWSMPLQETCSVPGTSPSPLTANSVAPRKLSSISLKISQSSHPSPLLSHCEELPTLGKEATMQAGGRLAHSPPLNLPPGGAMHSEGPGNPGLAKPSRMPTVPSRMPAVRKPLVCSCLALPFQSQLTQSSASFVRPGQEGPGHTRTSLGRGKSRSSGLPRPQRGPQRASPVLSLSSQDTTKADVSRQLAAMARTRPSLNISLVAQNTSRRDTGIPALDTNLGKATNLASAGKAKPGIGLNLITVQTPKPSKIMDLRTAAPDKLGRGTATTAMAKPDLATRDISMDLDTLDLNKLAPSTATGDIARLGTPMALARANIAKVDLAQESPTWNTSKPSPAMSSVVPGSPEPPCGETTLDDVDNLPPWDMATYPPTPRSSVTPEHGTVAFATQELARAYKGLPETRTDAAMSELVPEPRPKPAVPMKPVSINSNLLGYIGIDTIIEQMRKKTMKTGFDFNIMVVGQSGLGKSTLVNTLFKSQVSRKASSWSREEKIPKTVEIKAIGHGPWDEGAFSLNSPVIEEGGVKMKLTVIDTPGFGDQINNENCWEPIEKYINEQYEKFLKEEVNIARKKRIPDTRVHCCLYFISPTGHSLRPLDLEFMKHLSKVVNIIPVIAKADTMTLDEKSEFKQRVRKELEVHGIEFYPQKEFDEDLEDKTENDKIRESMPFAVVGSDKEYQVNGKRVLGRKTPWGIIEVENLHHCEFALLRDFVIRTHLQDLKEVTHNIHYETYRAKRLNDNGGLPPGEGLLGTVLPPVPATPCPTAE